MEITESGADQLSYTLSPEVIPEDWFRTIEDCTISPSITLIAGPSGAGKSTLARRLVNRYLTGLGKNARPTPAVFYLDLDPKHQEYAPSGQVSLLVVRNLNLGPNFTHPAISPDVESLGGNELVRAHPIPTNLATYLDYYHACVEDLFFTHSSLCSHHPSVPLVIKTSSFLYDSNFEVFSKLLAQIKPHNVIHLGETQPLDVDTATKSTTLQAVASQYRSTFHGVTACRPSSIPNRTGSEDNTMQMQSYFHMSSSKMKSRKPFTSTWTSESLSSMVPWEVCYQETSDRTQDLVGFAIYTEPVEPASLLHILNGSIVHIILSTSPVVLDAYTALPRAGKHAIPYFPKSERTGRVEPLDPRSSKFICVAMIRGFDPEKKIVQVLVPSTHEALLYKLTPKQTVFVSGCCDAPEWAFVEDEYAREQAEQDTVFRPPKRISDHTLWTEERLVADGMGYLNAVRRVRKFQT